MSKTQKWTIWSGYFPVAGGYLVWWGLLLLTWPEPSELLGMDRCFMRFETCLIETCFFMFYVCQNLTWLLKHIECTWKVAYWKSNTSSGWKCPANIHNVSFWAEDRLRFPMQVLQMDASEGAQSDTFLDQLSAQMVFYVAWWKVG